MEERLQINTRLFSQRIPCLRVSSSPHAKSTHMAVDHGTRIATGHDLPGKSVSRYCTSPDGAPGADVSPIYTRWGKHEYPRPHARLTPRHAPRTSLAPKRHPSRLGGERRGWLLRGVENSCRVEKFSVRCLIKIPVVDPCRPS